MNWKHVKSLFGRDYSSIYNHYVNAPDDVDEISKFCKEWYAARAYKLMIGESRYADYYSKYESIFAKYPNYSAEPLYELCQTSPTVQERYELYKRCLSCSIEIEQKGVLKWKALCGFIVECYNLEKYDEAYDAWMSLESQHALDNVHSKYGGWIQHVTKCGIACEKKIETDCSYAKFRSELKSIPQSHSLNDTHMVWVKGYRTYSVIQYLAIRCAYDIRSQGNIYVYNDVEPENNEWWELSKKYATIIRVTPPKHINGKHIPYAQHVADIMRVCIIYEFGGMYIDSDLLLIKDVSRVVDACRKIGFGDVVMCKETENKVWNGMIVAEPHNSFLRRWIGQYETKYGDPEGGCWWAGLSVERPMRLYREDCTDIVLLDTFTFLPFGFYDDHIYQEGDKDPYPLSYGVHLWETEAEKRGVLPKNKEWFEDHKRSIFAQLFAKYI